MRNAHPALRMGRVESCRHQGDLLWITRSMDGKQVTWLLNFGPHHVPLGPDHAGRTVIETFNGADRTALPPYAGLLLEG